MQLIQAWHSTLNAPIFHLQTRSLIFICFDLFCFDSIQIFREIASLSFQVSWGDQFLTEVKKFLDSGIFRSGLSNFQLGVWFPFDAFQFIQESWILYQISCVIFFENVDFISFFRNSQLELLTTYMTDFRHCQTQNILNFFNDSLSLMLAHSESTRLLPKLQNNRPLVIRPLCPILPFFIFSFFFVSLSACYDDVSRHELCLFTPTKKLDRS